VAPGLEAAGVGAAAVGAGALATLWRLPSSRDASRWFSVVCWAVTVMCALVVLAARTGA
jgi:hypothetical protein